MSQKLLIICQALHFKVVDSEPPYCIFFCVVRTIFFLSTITNPSLNKQDKINNLYPVAAPLGFVQIMETGHDSENILMQLLDELAN